MKSMNSEQHIENVRAAFDTYREARTVSRHALVEAVKAGVVMRQIAEAADMDPAYVRKIARDAGIEPRHPGRRKDQP